MNAEAALLQALHQRPGDDIAWLALADCLEEQGQPDRAELLRLSRALRTLPQGERRQAAEQRMCDLLLAGVLPCVPTLANSIGMSFVLVPAGTFWMGSIRGERWRSSDELRHAVEITRAYYLGAHLVTQGQYRKVTRKNPSAFRRGGESADLLKKKDDPRHFPVERVTWDEAVAFCTALSDLPEEKAANRTYRLPTEAEWEHACRAGTSTPFAFGSSLTAAQANFNGKHPYGEGAAKGPYRQRPTRVGSFPPNAFGLFDMHGNVWEWCADRYGSYSRKAPRQDPTGPATGEARILRGGCWYWHAREARSAYRSHVDPGYRNYCVGFRVVMEANGAA